VIPRDATIMGHLALYLAKRRLHPGQRFIKRARSIDPSDVFPLYSAVVDTIANERSRRSRLCGPHCKKDSVGDVESEPEFAPLRLSPDYQAMISNFAPKGH